MNEISSIEQSLKQVLLKYEHGVSLLLILFTNLLVLGRYSFLLGIYYDELATFYILERFSFLHVWEIAGGQARHLAAALISIMGVNFTLGHLGMLLITSLNAFLLMYLFRKVIPSKPFLGTLFGVLYLVYPAYFVRTYLTVLAVDASLLVALVSVFLSYWSIRRTGFWRYALVVISALLIPVYVNLYEMPIALEVLRPFVIWATLRELGSGERTNIRQVALWSSLWILVSGMTVFYRLFIFEPYGFYGSIEYNTALAIPSDNTSILQYIVSGLGGVQALLINVWSIIVQNFSRLIHLYGLIVASILSLLVFGFSLFYSKNFVSHGRTSIRAALYLAYVGIGFSFLASILVVLVGRGISRDAYFFHHLSRLNIAGQLGAILVILAFFWLLGSLFKNRFGRIFASFGIAALVFGGTVAHSFWNQFHAEAWNKMLDTYWQLAELAPNFEDGTTVIISDDHNPISLIYINFIIGDFFYNNPSIVVVSELQLLDDLFASGFIVDSGTWEFGWETNLEQAVYVYENEDGCLQIIDPSSIPEDLDLQDRTLALLERLPANPSQYILEDEIEDTSLRNRYFPRPAMLPCEENLDE